MSYCTVLYFILIIFMIFNITLIRIIVSVVVIIIFDIIVITNKTDCHHRSMYGIFKEFCQ